MIDLATVARPIIGAPMAGGPSTPTLVEAVGAAGGFGMLAAGYLTPAALADAMAATRGPFGVNLFCPPDTEPDLASAQAYRESLAPLAQQYAVELPPVAVAAAADDDHWAEKVDLLCERPPAAVSFTFGLPDAETVERLHARDCTLLATVASVADARAAAALGVDAMCVQGPEAGGHRATRRIADEPEDVPLLELIAAVRAAVSVPVIAAGGLMDAAAVEAVLKAGAVAAQVGTALLLADEAGTSATHRAALTDPQFTETAVTRAFTGRPARGLRNDFVERYDTGAPAAYPAVHQITRPIRAAAAAARNPAHVHLWAGTGWHHARPAPAADIITRLTPA